MVHPLELGPSRFAMLLLLCTSLSACAHSQYPRVIVRDPGVVTAAPVAPAYVAAPAVIMAAPSLQGPAAAAPPPSSAPAPIGVAPAPSAVPTPFTTAAAPAPTPAPLAPYAPQASPLLAYDSSPQGSPPAQPDVLFMPPVRRRVTTYYTPYYRYPSSYGYAPYYGTRPYYRYPSSYGYAPYYDSRPYYRSGYYRPRAGLVGLGVGLAVGLGLGHLGRHGGHHGHISHHRGRR